MDGAPPKETEKAEYRDSPREKASLTGKNPQAAEANSSKLRYVAALSTSIGWEVGSR
jgi:hypothetical protein